jgi:16S rRNA (guanine966-N2)-methyltransferase
VPGSRCLDLFAGSGALGLEAASRGAREVWLIERDQQLTQLLHTALMTLRAEQVQLKQADAFKWLAGPPTPFDVVFLDPPFAQNNMQPCCWQLEQRGWLSAEAHIYLEVEHNLPDLTLPDNWRILKQQQVGHAKGMLALRTAA